MKDPLLDRTLAGRFQIRSRIGEGGMSVVYLARDLKEGGEAAVKLLHQHLVDTEEYVGRFEQEARTAGRLSHPNAVSILDSGVADGLPYIAMEYCEGRSLKRIISEEAPLAVGRAADLAAQILSALAAAHEMGIIHRDLKPENVRVAVHRGREIVKVLDFGVAKFVGSDRVKEMTGAIKTKTGIVFGTPKYMAPEQIMGEDIDSRIDVYAAGVLLYEMLAGAPPFDSEDLYGFVTKHLHQPAPPIREKVPDLAIPEGLEQLVLRALSKEREARPADAGVFAQELQPFVVRTRASRGRQYGPAAAGLLLGGAAGAAAAVALATPGPGLELAVASAALGLFAGAGFIAFGRTATRNLLLRLMLVLLGTGLAELVLWIAHGGDGVLHAASALVATFVFVLFSVARGLGVRGWRPLLGLVGGAVAGALYPVLDGGVYLRLWQAPLDAQRAAGFLASAAIGTAFGLGGLLAPREAPGGVSPAKAVRNGSSEGKTA